MENKMPSTEATESIRESAPVTPQFGGVPAGLDMNSPEAQQALTEYGRTAGYIKSGIMGAAAGATAGQGAAHPLTAFIQGMGAGVQMNAQLYEQKKAQIQSVVDATPFASTHPELAAPGKPYELLGGMPTALAMKVLQQAAIDTNKVLQEHKAKSEEMALGAEMERRNKLFEMSLKGKDPMSIKDRVELADKFINLPPVKDYTLAKSAYETIINSEPGIGDKVAVIKFAQMLNPSVRVNDQTMDSLDASGTFDKFTHDAWLKAKTGAILAPQERAKLIKEAGKIYAQRRNDYHAVTDKVTEDAIDNGFNPKDIIIDKPINVETIQLKDGRWAKAQVVGLDANGRKQYRIISGTEEGI